jgi:RNA polymerase sigma-32 factor
MSSLSIIPQVSLPSPTQFPAYARAINALPLLTEEQEASLVRAWQEDDDREAARQLVLAHLRLVVRVVRDHEGYGLPAGDLAQEGTVGLMRAVQKFLPKFGVRLASYALAWIEAEVREYILKNWRIVRMSTSGWGKKLFFGYRKAMNDVADYGPARSSNLHQEEVAKMLGVSVSQAAIAAQFFGTTDVSIDVQDDPNDADQRPGSMALVAASMTSLELTPEEHCADQEHESQLSDVLQKALQFLPARDRDIVSSRYLSSPPKALQPLAKKWGISAERVRQIEAVSLKKLRIIIEDGSDEMLRLPLIAQA